jgi:beta-glucosidase
VPQVYLGPSSRLPAGVRQAIAELIGFGRVDLCRTDQGASRCTPTGSWSGGTWVAGTGTRTLWVGSPSRPPACHVRVTVR